MFAPRGHVHSLYKAVTSLFKNDFKPEPNDFIIILMGPTGCGKTNFINSLTGNTERRGAGDLKSDTQDVTPYSIPYQDLRVVLVDTPGFDDTNRPDSEILRKIADWLTQKYPDGTTLKIGGIIYFHRITDNRMTGSASNNLQVFGRLCGNIPLPRTRLVTTMWDLMNDTVVAKKRETQLKGVFWQKLIDGGATADQFHNTRHSAWHIVQALLSMGKEGDDLLLQEELVEQGKRLSETEAGKVLYSRLQKLLADQKRTLKELATQAKQQNNPALVESLEEEYEKINAQLQGTFEEMKKMRIPLSRRILLWLSGRKSRAKVVVPDCVSST